MDMMRRHDILASQTMAYSGIPVFVDNGLYTASSGKADAFTTDDRFFLAGPFDTGTNAAKAITYKRYSDQTASGGNVCFRQFNDLTATCIDYWGMTDSSETQRTVSFSSRYIIASIPKAKAADMYMTMTVDGVTTYLYKGSNVT